MNRTAPLTSLFPSSTTPRLISLHSRHLALQGREFFLVPPYQNSLILVNKKKNLEGLIRIFFTENSSNGGPQRKLQASGKKPSVTPPQQHEHKLLSPGHEPQCHIPTSRNKQAFCTQKPEIQTKSNSLPLPNLRHLKVLPALLLRLAGGRTYQQDIRTRRCYSCLTPPVIQFCVRSRLGPGL